MEKNWLVFLMSFAHLWHAVKRQKFELAGLIFAKAAPHVWRLKTRSLHTRRPLQPWRLLAMQTKNVLFQQKTRKLVIILSDHLFRCRFTFLSQEKGWLEISVGHTARDASWRHHTRSVTWFGCGNCLAQLGTTNRMFPVQWDKVYITQVGAPDWSWMMLDGLQPVFCHPGSLRIAFNAAMSACAKAKHWQKANQLYTRKDVLGVAKQKVCF